MSAQLTARALRLLEFSVIVIADDDIWPAFNIGQLGTFFYLSEPKTVSNKIRVIDRTGEEFIYLSGQIALVPGIARKNGPK
jgi:hypothetical protein